MCDSRQPLNGADSVGESGQSDRIHRTEAVRSLLADPSVLLMMDSQGEIIGLNEGELELQLLAIEDEASAAPPEPPE